MDRAEIYDAGNIISNLRRDARVQGVAPRLGIQVFYNVGMVDIAGMISGIDVAEEDRLFKFKDT